MDRREYKAAARQQTARAGNSPKIITLIFLLSSALILALRYAASILSEQAGSGKNYLSDSIAAGARTMLLSFAITFALQLVLVLLMAGYTAMILRLRKGEETAPGDLLRGFHTAGRVILLDVLKALRLILWSYAFSLPAGYLLALGMMGQVPVSQELIMVGLYAYVCIVMFLVSYRYRLSYFILMDHPEFSASQALKRAAAMTKGHRLELFLMDLSFLPWLLLSAFTCGILLIWKLPYIAASYAGCYDGLTRDYEARQARIRELIEQQNFPR